MKQWNEETQRLMKQEFVRRLNEIINKAMEKLNEDSKIQENQWEIGNKYNGHINSPSKT